MFALGCILILQGCGGGKVEPQQAIETSSGRLISELQSKLEQARKDLTQQEERAEAFAAHVQSLTAQMTELQKKLAEKAAAEPSKSPGEGRPTDEGKAGDLDRIELIGQKALLEYKINQLTLRVSSLTDELSRKDRELTEIRAGEGGKQAEVETLRKKVQELQAKAEAEAAELKSSAAAESADLKERLAQMSQKLQERAEAASRLKEEFDEQAALVKTLKSAVTDGGTVKSLAEAEVARLRAQLDSTAKSLEASRMEAQRKREEAAQARTEAQQAGEELEQVRQEVDKWRQAAEQYKAEVEQQQRLAEELKKQASELTAKLQALEAQRRAEQQPGPSAVDRILETPLEREMDAPSSHLY